MVERKAWEATQEGLIQPPVAEDGFAYRPITVSQARAMLSLCKPSTKKEILAAIAKAEGRQP